MSSVTRKNKTTDSVPIVFGFLGRPSRTKIFLHIISGVMLRAYSVEMLTSDSNRYCEFEEIPNSEREENYDCDF